MEDTIILDLKRGRKDSFRKLFELHFHALLGFGFNYISDRQVLEDIIQEIFISFWEKRKDFDHLYSIKSFLYTSVKNRCINHLKHLEVKRKNEESIIARMDKDEDADSYILKEEVYNQLYLEIKDLPKSSREIMLLALNGLKNPEIADELGISVNTVKTQKKLAYAKLKDRLSPLQTLRFLLIL